MVGMSHPLHYHCCQLSHNQVLCDGGNPHLQIEASSYMLCHSAVSPIWKQQTSNEDPRALLLRIEKMGSNEVIAWMHLYSVSVYSLRS